MKALAATVAAGALSLVGIGLALSPANAAPGCSDATTGAACVALSNYQDGSAIDSSYVWNVDANGGSLQVTANTNQTYWYASYNGAWESLQNSIGTDNAHFTLKVAANRDAAQRTGTVTVRAGSASVTFTVVQAGDDFPNTIAKTPTDNLQTIGSYTYTGTLVDACDIDIVAMTMPWHGDYTIQGSGTGFSWKLESVHATVYSYSRSDVQQLVTSNLKAGTYYLVVRSGTGFKAPNTWTITLGGPATTSDMVSIAPDPQGQTGHYFSMAAHTGEAKFQITSNQTWKAKAMNTDFQSGAETTSATWLCITPCGGNQAFLYVTASTNNTGSARYATITVTAGDAVATLKIMQAPVGTDDYGNTEATATPWVTDATTGQVSPSDFVLDPVMGTTTPTAAHASGTLEQATDHDFLKFTPSFTGTYTFTGTASFADPLGGGYGLSGDQVNPVANPDKLVVVIHGACGGVFYSTATTWYNGTDVTYSGSVKLTAGQTYYVEVYDCDCLQINPGAWTMDVTATPEATLRVEGSTVIYAPSMASSYQVQISSYPGWTATAFNSSITLANGSGTAGTTATGYNGDTLTINVAADPKVWGYSYTVRLTSGNKTVNITIIQSGNPNGSWT